MISLVAFETVARHGSFLGASEELALSQSTVSYRIKNLEDIVGTALFSRLTRRVELTPAGTDLLKTVKNILRDLSAGIEGLIANDRLTVKISTYLAARWLSPRLKDWNSHPGSVLVELSHDFGKSSMESDIAIIWSKNVFSQDPSRVLFQTNMSPHCTPEVAATLKRPSDVLNYPLLAFEPAMDPWDEWFELAGVTNASKAKFVVMPDSNVRIRAAVDGLGIVLANHLVESEISEGKLVRPFDLDLVGPGFHVETNPMSPPMIDEFVAWLRDQGKDRRAHLSD